MIFLSNAISLMFVYESGLGMAKIDRFRTFYNQSFTIILLFRDSRNREGEPNAALDSIFQGVRPCYLCMAANQSMNLTQGYLA